jgi:hypothetical protein
LAFDYQFDINHTYDSSVTNAVLLGCYEDTNNAIYGFRLYWDPKDEFVRIGFGDTRYDKANRTKIISDYKASKYRNIIVLRHAQNDEYLYIYSGIRFRSGGGLNSNSSQEVFDSIEADGFVQTLSWSNISTDAKLVLGALSTNTISSNEITNAYGKIFWAKYWNYDVGAGECR